VKTQMKKKMQSAFSAKKPSWIQLVMREWFIVCHIRNGHMKSLLELTQ
jgi:hypothetical protein